MTFFSDVARFIASGAGAITRALSEKAQELPSVKDFAAVGDGVANDTAAFTAARTATGGRYHIPDGTYLVDASPDVWLDNFTSSGAAFLKISGITYDVSNAVCGNWRMKVLNQRYMEFRNARTGEVLVRWSDGELAGDSHVFYLPIDVRRDSHSFIVSPETDGGVCDYLWRRSQANADPGGNRFSESYTESSDTWQLSYATSASGSPSFDAVYQVVAGPSGTLKFPALRAEFNQGIKIKQRSAGGFEYNVSPTSTRATFRDGVTSNLLGSVNEKGHRFAGVTFNPLNTVGGVADGPQRFGISANDLGTADQALPISKTLFTLAGATNYAIAGKITVAAVTSGGTKAWRIAHFTYDGTTLTMTDVVNTLPVQIVARVINSGSNLNLDASYAGGLGTGYSICIDVEWCQVGR